MNKERVEARLHAGEKQRRDCVTAGVAARKESLAVGSIGGGGFLSLAIFRAKNQTYAENLGMGGSPVDLGSLSVESFQIPGYGWFNCPAWAGHPPESLGGSVHLPLTSGLPARIFVKVVPSTFRIST
ncbi:hypothetical protein GW17_00044697 [Ensete ventricosum]|nr:hypothetical protein GW17_00044697 [Ensete ventricosum]